MFEFGDELILNSYRIPSLIWIQLLAMLLLLILLYYSTSDLSLHLSTASPSATALSYVNSTATTTRHNSKIRENEIKETRASTSEVVQRAKKPNARQRAELSTANAGSAEHSHHPCHIFGLAKHAFLKCLGIDSTPDRHHEKKD